MTTTPYALDETRARALLHALHAEATNRPLTDDDELAIGEAGEAVHDELVAGIEDFNPDGDASAEDVIYGLLATMWDAGILTGPARPSFASDNDPNDVHYHYEFTLGYGVAAVTLTTEDSSWSYLILHNLPDGTDPTPVDRLMYVLADALGDLNNALARHDAYLDAAFAARTLDVPAGHLAVNVDGRTVATFPTPGYQGDNVLVTLDGRRRDTSEPQPLVGFDVWHEHVEVAHWPDNIEWAEVLTVPLSRIDAPRED